MRRHRVHAVVLSIFLLFPPFLPVWADGPAVDPGRLAGPPPIACRFEWRVIPAGGEEQEVRSEWFLWRRPSLIEIREKGGVGEVWERGLDRRISYRRVFHEERRVIEYTPGDLRALRRAPDWARLSSLVDPDLLGRDLKRSGEEERLGRRAERYRGRLDGVEVELLWLPQERIPALIREIYPDRERQLRLIEMYPLEESPWPHGRFAEYRHTDYADIGDQEADPFLRKRLNEGSHDH